MKPDWVVQPTPVTLRKYGLTVEDWVAIGDRQHWYCPCGRRPSTGKFNIDHEHAKNWKKMKPEDRKQYVRGIVCWTCNFYQLARGATAERLRALADYLDVYEGRRHG